MKVIDLTAELKKDDKASDTTLPTNQDLTKNGGTTKKPQLNLLGNKGGGGLKDGKLLQELFKKQFKIQIQSKISKRKNELRTIKMMKLMQPGEEPLMESINEYAANTNYTVQIYNKQRDSMSLFNGLTDICKLIAPNMEST